MIHCCNEYFFDPPTTPSAIASQYLLFNSNIIINKTVMFYEEFTENQLNVSLIFYISMEN